MRTMPSVLPAITTRQAVALGLVLLFVALGVRQAFKVEEGGSAIRRWRPQLEQLREGVDLSARHNYPHPPVMAVLLEPLTLLPPLAGAMTWFALEAAFALVAFWQVFRLVESRGAPFPPGALFLAALLSLKPVLDELHHGNVNLFILVLLTSALTALRHRRDLLAGLLFGLATACKVTPALFLPYLVWKRAWRAVAGCVLGLVLFLYPGVVPSLRLGFERNQQQLASWYRVMARPYLVEGKVTTEYVNQSLPGTLFRLATPSPSFLRWVGDHPVAVRFDNWLALSPAEARWLVRGCLVLFALAVLWSCRTPLAERGSWRLAAEAGVIVLGMLVFSERTWKHHAVTLVLPIGVIIYRVVVASHSLRERWALGTALAAALLLILLPGLGTTRTRLDAASDPGFAKVMLAQGAYTWAFILLLIALVVTLGRDTRARLIACRVHPVEMAVATQPELKVHLRPPPKPPQVTQRIA